MSILDAGRQVADAVLYEGYLLYPYTASARKNQLRWQFGVVVPRAYGEGGSGEPWRMQTEALFEAPAEAGCQILVRFLHVQSRNVETREGESFVPAESLTVDGKQYVSWEEAVEREVQCELHAAETLIEMPIDVPESSTTEILQGNDGTIAGRLVRRCDALKGSLALQVEPAGELRKIRVTIENHSELVCESEEPSSVKRNVALRSSFISTHTLMALSEGVFLSLLDPPDGAAELAKTCRNEHTWPVLISEKGAADRPPHQSIGMLSSPIILYDYPAIAPQSEGDKFDGTEIDELLNLSVLALSDEEKENARATDERARGIIDRADQMAPEHFAKLHGALRYLETVAQPRENLDGGEISDNGGGISEFRPFDEEVPGAGHIYINGTKIETGSRVRLRPVRRADVWDMFLDGKTARVTGVFEDLENQHYLAVTVDDDPANEMHDWYGRYLYFYPNEVEAMETTS